MSLFRARPAPPERRHDPNAIPSNVDAGGYRNTTGQIVSTDSALRLAAVYGSVSLISDALSTTPIDVYRKRGDLREELETPPLLNMPSGTTTPVEWLAMALGSVLVRGNTYGIKDNFDALGYPREIHLVHPDEVTVQHTSTDDRRPLYRFGGKEIDRRLVFHLKGFCLPGALEGLSPVANFAQTIGAGLASEEFGSRFYSEGGHPTGVLQSDQKVDQEQAELLKARLMAAIRGRREPIVLGAGTKWQSIQVPPNESMFLENSRFSALQIASMIYHVPPSMLGVAIEGSSLTYSNREQDEILLQTRALLPWAIRFEQHLSRLLPGKQFVRFNMDAAVRVDLTTRYKAHAIGIAAKFLTPDEARQLEDRPPLTAAQKKELALAPALTLAPPPSEEDIPA